MRAFEESSEWKEGKEQTVPTEIDRCGLRSARTSGGITVIDRTATGALTPDDRVTRQKGHIMM